ncbi:MAG: helix-turn-helix transcriptional regulator [Clostridia bacterium]|nr:helix-turn-helix transcriptional regulator [Clostridia bacterium]
MAGTKLAVDLGERIRQLRLSRDWSQQDLARRAGITNKSMISYYELGERMPSYPVLLRLSAIFCVSIDCLLKGKEGKEINIGNIDDTAADALLTIISKLQQQQD